ncbi:MAG: hypothetical protein ACYC7D_11600 [Nitrososphaerales archaeon]
MVSDNDMGTDGGSNSDENQDTMMPGEGSTESSYGAEQGMEGQQESTPETEAKTKSTRGGGRRAALKIIRQNVETVSKDLSSFRKNHEVSSKKLEKQVASLRNDLNALKSYISKESARARSKQEASFSKILAKLNTPKPKAKKAPKKKTAKSKSKGKK